MASRHTSKTADSITYNGWVAFDDAGNMRLTRTRPSLGPAERVASFQMTAPKSLWKEPQMGINVRIEDGGDLQKTITEVAAKLDTYTKLEVRVEPRGVVDVVQGVPVPAPVKELAKAAKGAR